MEVKILIAAGIVILFAVIIGYNKAVSLRNYVKEAFSTMDVYLKKRWDLIPNLVECVKAYAAHEKTVFTNLADLRSKSYNELSQNEKLNVNEKLTYALPKLIAVAENCPELKANENFSKLMQELSKIEEDIANARKYYNGTVRELNNFLEIFPSNIIGKVFGFHTEKMFEIDDTQRQNVKVDFS